MIVKYISEAMLKLIANTGTHPLNAAAAAGVAVHTSARNRRRLDKKRRR